MILLDPDARPVIGHRGASGDYPENTILAFAKALEAGADAIEFDIRLTADGVPVVIHDPTLDRTTDGNGPVNQQSLSSLDARDAGAGQRIPTLDSVLEEFRPTPMIVEIKETGAATAVRERIISHGVEANVVVGSFESAALRKFDPCRFNVAASRPGTGVFFAGSRLGFAVKGNYGAFCIPEYNGSLRIVDRKFVVSARKRGKPVHVWTVNDIAVARRLREAGVCGLITNYPGKMSGLEN